MRLMALLCGLTLIACTPATAGDVGASKVAGPTPATSATDTATAVVIGVAVNAPTTGRETNEALSAGARTRSGEAHASGKPIGRRS
jgi:hypothetical protein